MILSALILLNLKCYRVMGHPVLQSAGGACIEFAERAEQVSERGFADFGFEFILQAIECGDDAEGASAALRPKREQVGAGVAGIDFALQKSFGLQRRDAVTEIAACGGEGFGELRRLDLARSLEKERCEDQCFEKAEAVGSEDPRGERLEASGSSVDGEHGAFAKESVDAHG